MMLSAEERAELTPKRRAAYKIAQARRACIAEFRENNHAIEAVESMEVALGAGGDRIRSSSRTR